MTEPEDAVLDYLHSRPGMARPVRDAIVWASRHPRPFKWYEVKVWPKVLDQLTVAGVLDRLEGAQYVFPDPQAVLRALARYEGELREVRERALRPGAAVSPPPGAPPDLFSEIVGYPDVKRQVLLALTARDPVHVLLHGPPATAKSLFLEGLATLPGAVYRFADGMSRAGIRRYLLDEKPPFLVVDEIEKFADDEDTVLLEFMERQRISQMVTGRNRDEAINIRVFAAANDVRHMRPELLSRFHRVALREYTADEFREVAFQYLLKRGSAPGLARAVADAVAVRTRDIRDCRRIASMARTEDDAAFLVGQLGREASV